MEKQHLPSHEVAPQPRGPRASRPFKSIAKFSAVWLLVWLLYHTHSITGGGDGPPRIPEDVNDPRAIWDSLPWSTELEYTPCFGNHQCARLKVPMDYWNGTTNASVGLAIVKKPAVVPVTDPRYGGPILLNPGGPGGSGVGFALGGGDAIRHVVDPESGPDSNDNKDAKYFDVIGFDPRGVGATLPAVRCFSDADASLEHSWLVRTIEEGIFGTSDAAFGRLWSMNLARGRSCSLPTDGPDVKEYVSTAYVARDIIEIVEAHGRWREKEAARLWQHGHGCDAANRRQRSVVAMPEALREMVSYKNNDEKVQYWGFSYGTYLGATLAAMFPDRVGRVIIDGVVDAYDYRKSLWYDNLEDTEKDLDEFYYHCARVGRSNCPLANETGETTAEGVKNRTLAILQSLYHNPLPVVGDYPEVITLSNVKDVIFGALYSPYQTFPFVAALLASLEKGDGSLLAPALLGTHQFRCSDRDRGRNTASIMGDASMAIACSDGDSQALVDKKHFEKHWHKLEKLSPSSGAIWATLRMRCVPYSVRAHHRFTAPWHANTSHPLLLIGNTADPVTPLSAAKKISKGFPGSVVLTQDSPGHCSVAAFSNCTHHHVRNYFQTGELPPENTVCEPDFKPFGPTPGETRVEDVSLLRAEQFNRDLAIALQEVVVGTMFPRAQSSVENIMGLVASSKIEKRKQVAA